MLAADLAFDLMVALETPRVEVEAPSRPRIQLSAEEFVRFWAKTVEGIPPAFKELRRWLTVDQARRVRSTTCKLWTCYTVRGYGQFRAGGKTQQAHIAIYEHLVGPVPEGCELDHLCMRKSCVETLHEEPVTGAENKRRAAAARPKLKACLRGHPRTPGNLYKNNACKQCERMRER